MRTSPPISLRPGSPPPPAASALRRFTLGAAALPVVTAVLVLGRGRIGAERLDALLAGSRFATPNAVAISLLCGLSLLALSPPAPSPRRRLLGRALAAAGALWAGIFLVEYIFRLDLGVDLLLGSVRYSPISEFPGRPAPQTAAVMLLPGLALLCLDSRTRRGRNPVPVMAMASIILALVALLGHLFEAVEYTGVDGLPYTLLAPLNAVSLLSLGAGILAARPDDGPMPVLLSEDVGGIAVRRLLLGLATYGPVAFLAGMGTYWGWYSRPVAIALVAFGGLVAATNGILRMGRRLDELSVSRRRSEERARVVIENASDGFFTADLEGRLLEINASGARLTGYSREELLGRSLETLLLAEDVPRARGLRERLLGGGSDFGEWTLRRKDGSRLPVEVASQILPDGRWLAFARDASARKNAEQALRATVGELEDFAYVVSHNLRSPLRAIQGYSHMASSRLRGRADPETLAMLERIDGAAVRLDRLIRDVLSYGAIARRPFSSERVSLDDVLAHALAVLPVVRKAGVRVRAPLGCVRGQPSLALLVLSNLLENAVKFVPPGRAPQVEAWTEDAGAGRLRLIVADNGRGVPADLLDKIFRPFEKLESDTPGTGIGLAIVKRAVERMGGNVGVSSRPGEGSRFWAELRRA